MSTKFTITQLSFSTYNYIFLCFVDNKFTIIKNIDLTGSYEYPCSCPDLLEADVMNDDAPADA